MEITINEQQRLFVMKHDDHVTCLGFDVVYNTCRELERRIREFQILPLGVELIRALPDEIGTTKQYEQYRDLMRIVGTRKTGTWFSYETPEEVRGILERYRKDGGKLRLFYGDKKSGLCWLEENDVVGRIGRSTGSMPVPLLIAEGDRGGPGVLDSCIVRIMDADTREELYRTKNFFLPEMEIRACNETLRTKGYTHGVWVKSKTNVMENHANCSSLGKAAQWVAFMSGECMEQPC